jgi:cytidylate kinase
MYRAVTYFVLQQGLLANQYEQIIPLLSQINLSFVPSAEQQKVVLNKEDITRAIRTPEVSRNVSEISSYKEVRTFLVQQQKEMAEKRGVVMDGRDIGTAVLPDAALKIFLTASVEERARRRFEETKGTSNEIPFDQLKNEIAARDLADSTRAISPLIQADDAILVDTTEMTMQQVIAHLLNLANQILKQGDES